MIRPFRVPSGCSEVLVPVLFAATVALPLVGVTAARLPRHNAPALLLEQLVSFAFIAAESNAQSRIMPAIQTPGPDVGRAAKRKIEKSQNSLAKT